MKRLIEQFIEVVDAVKREIDIYLTIRKCIRANRKA